jgi:hypothetical protein
MAGSASAKTSPRNDDAQGLLNVDSGRPLNVTPRRSIPLDECSFDRIGLLGGSRPCR